MHKRIHLLRLLYRSAISTDIRQIIQKYLLIMAENDEALCGWHAERVRLTSLDVCCHSDWLPVADFVKLS